MGMTAETGRLRVCPFTVQGPRRSLAPPSVMWAAGGGFGPRDAPLAQTVHTISPGCWLPVSLLTLDACEA